MKGYYIEKKGVIDVVNEMLDSGKEVFILDKRGKDIRSIEIGKNPVFILGDHDGIPKNELKRLKNICKGLLLCIKKACFCLLFFHNT